MTAAMVWAAGAQGQGQTVPSIGVNAFSGAGWSRVYETAVPIEWDWGWEWVGEGAVRAEVTVSGLKHRTKREYAVEKPEDGVMVEFGVPTPETEDAYEVKIVFRDAGGAETGRRTAQVDLLAGSFGGTEVKTGEKTGKEWKTVKSRAALAGWDAGWFGAEGELALKTHSAAKGEREFGLGERSGVMALRDSGLTEIGLWSGGGLLAGGVLDFLPHGFILTVR